MGRKGRLFHLDLGFVRFTVTKDDLGKKILPSAIALATGGAGAAAVTLAATNLTENSSNTSVKQFGEQVVKKAAENPEVFSRKTEIIVPKNKRILIEKDESDSVAENIEADEIFERRVSDEWNGIGKKFDSSVESKLFPTSKGNLNGYFDFTKTGRGGQPVLQFSLDNQRFDFSPSSFTQIKFLDVPENEGMKIGLINGINESGINTGISIKDENKITSYKYGVDWILSTDAEIFVSKTDTWLHLNDNSSNDRIASIKANDGRVDVYHPICGHIGSIRTKTTVSGDRISQEVRQGINIVSSSTCIASTAIPATKGIKVLKYGKNFIFENFLGGRKFILSYK